MFDLEVFVGPAIVLFGMFIGLLGFAIWGTRAIRESVPVQSGAYSQSMAPLIDGGDFDAEAAAPLAELELPGIEGAEQLDDEQKPAVNLEKTAEFEQPLTSVNTVASFSQSFWEGQEVATPGQSDYNDAIDRIQAGLDAADAEEFNKNAVDADVIAAADVLEALRHGVANGGANGGADNINTINKEETRTSEPAQTAAEEAAAEKPAVGNIVPEEAKSAETAPEDTALEETLSGEITSEEILSEENKAAELISEEAAAEKTTAAETVLQENLPEETDNEATRLISSEEAEAILAPEEPAAPAVPAAPTSPDKVLPFHWQKQQAKPADNELANNMEETVVMQKIPGEEPPAPNLQRMPPGTRSSSSFGFITNQANGMASAVGMNPRQLPDLSNLTQEEAGDTLLPETPIPFGPKMAWLAIPGFKPSEVITALRLDDVQTANWTSGLQAAYADNNQVFVSPSLGGWVLVIGKTLWERADMNRSAENISWLKEICRKFGNACFFSTMRGLANHGWVGIRDGQIFRAYGYSGELQELIWLVGEPTEEEIAINPGFITEMREKYQPGFRPIVPDEKLVLAVAAAWSVDPGFRRRQYPADFGMVGRMN